MSYCYDIIVGDLVCLKSRNADQTLTGWLSIELDSGIVLEIIEIDHQFEFFNYKIRCYDYVIYWCKTEIIETIPDILLEKYTDWLRRINAR